MRSAAASAKAEAEQASTAGAAEAWPSHWGRCRSRQTRQTRCRRSHHRLLRCSRLLRSSLLRPGTSSTRRPLGHSQPRLLEPGFDSQPSAASCP